MTLMRRSRWLWILQAVRVDWFTNLKGKNMQKKYTLAPSAYRQNYTPSNDNDVVMAVLVGVVFLVLMPVISYFI
jgi:hypothetical protein